MLIYSILWANSHRDSLSSQQGHSSSPLLQAGQTFWSGYCAITEKYRVWESVNVHKYPFWILSCMSNGNNVVHCFEILYLSVCIVRSLVHKMPILNTHSNCKNVNGNNMVCWKQFVFQFEKKCSIFFLV